MNRIAPCHVTWWTNLRVPEGEADTFASWDELFRRFARRMPFLGQDVHPGWSPARFEPCKRGLDNVQQVYAICLDYDGGTTIAEARETWAGVYGMIHTSRKHSDDTHRFRVILPLARPVSPFEYGLLWKGLARKAGEVDQAPKDPSRFWFVPGAMSDAPFEALMLDGTPLNPDEWLARPEPSPQRRPLPSVAPDVEKRAVAYIDRMPEAISGSGGHQATWAVALVLARGFGLSEGATLRILRDHYNHRCSPPWSERELEHKARDAAASKETELGWLLKNEREDWRRYTAHYSAPSQPSQPSASFDDAPLPDDEHGAPDAPRVTGGAPVDTRPAAERHGLVSMRSLMQDVVAELNKPKPKPGACAGSEDLNTAIGGFRPGHVTVFGAKRGWGKTSYGNLVVSRAVPDYRVLMFAGEDAAAIYGRRFLAMRANLNAMALRDHHCDQSEWARIMKAVADAPPNPFFVRVDGRPVEWIAQVIQDVAAEEGGLDLVIVDYLQCIGAARKMQDRRNEVTYVCKTIGTAIKSVNAAGLVFSQLKRTERAEPEVEDLKESGDIEDMADHILLGWKHERKVGGRSVVDRKIKLGKNKDGVEATEVDEVLMRWNNRTASFEFTPACEPEWQRSAPPPRSFAEDDDWGDP